jgi:hypothetical protein
MILVIHHEINLFRNCFTFCIAQREQLYIPILLSILTSTLDIYIYQKFSPQITSGTSLG